MGIETFILAITTYLPGSMWTEKYLGDLTDHQGSLKSMRMPYSVEHLVNHVRKH